SICRMPGPLTRFLPAFPKVPAAGTAKAAGLIHSAVVDPPGGVSDTPGTRSGRWLWGLPVGTAEAGLATVTLTGSPGRRPMIQAEVRVILRAERGSVPCPASDLFIANLLTNDQSQRRLALSSAFVLSLEDDGIAAGPDVAFELYLCAQTAAGCRSGKRRE